jgi:Peptidylarginine deiminase and related enzymes
MEKEIRELRQRNGRPYRLIPLPSPAIRDRSGRFLPASYTNFLIINQAVLVPLYDTAEDGMALEIFHRSFADRNIIGINCRPLLYQYGSLHCVTMQLPAGVIL